MIPLPLVGPSLHGMFYPGHAPFSTGRICSVGAARVKATTKTTAVISFDNGDFILPIGSMVLLYMITWIPSIYPKC